MTIRESAEDYLEQILMLLEKKGHARSVDIAAGLNVSKPSVSVAMKKLRENGYITMPGPHPVLRPARRTGGYRPGRRVPDRARYLRGKLLRHPCPGQRSLSFGSDPEQKTPADMPVFLHSPALRQQP